MGTKTISDDAYARLKAEKREKESFTDAVIRLTRKRSLLEIAGFLDEGEAKEMEGTLKEMRRRSNARTLKIAEEIEGLIASWYGLFSLTHLARIMDLKLETY